MKKTKGFYLCNNRYYYCVETNTLVNAEFAEVYKKHSDSRIVDVEDVTIDVDSVKKNLKNIKLITFEITQACNLKCAYCTYESGEYYLSRPPGSSKSLSFATAQKALQHVWNIIKGRDNKELSLGFYGGEPLLNFETMKRIIQYAKELFQGWNIAFTMTTNGTLLDRHAIDYIIENDFMTFVSLDGPQSNHNSKRVFRNGRGSFRKVMKNLEHIRTISETYYRNKVYFSAVFSKDLTLEDMIDFFNDEELVKHNEVRLGFVTSTDTTYYEKKPYDVQRFNNSIEKILSSIRAKINEKKEISSIESDLCSPHRIMTESLLNRKFDTLMGTCFYDSRLYVDADGGFHICEKMNDKFQFGNIRDGFDYAKMVDITHQYTTLLKENCSQCEIRFICNKCYIHFAKDATFAMSEEFCTKEKRAQKKMLEDAIYFKENG